jgi:hypothetical protein
MKIKTNIRAGSGSTSGGTKSGGASGAGHNSPDNDVDPPKPAPVYYSRCVGI